MLAIAGGKGGCGKTTTALAIGAALPGRPRVVDADWDLPNLHRLAAVYRDGEGVPNRDVRGSGSTAGVTVDTMPVRIERLGELAVVPAPGPRDACEVSDWLTRLRGGEHDADGRVGGKQLAGEQAAGEQVTGKQLDSESVVSGQILVDCPAGASPDATAPLSVADATLLVTTPRPAAIRDTMKTAAMARTLNASPIGAVVVGTDSAPEGIQAALETPVVGCVPWVDSPVLARAGAASAYRAVGKKLAQGRLSPDR